MVDQTGSELRPTATSDYLTGSHYITAFVVPVHDPFGSEGDYEVSFASMVHILDQTSEHQTLHMWRPEN